MAGLTAARTRGRNGGRPQVAKDDARMLRMKKLSKISSTIFSMLKISRGILKKAFSRLHWEI